MKIFESKRIININYHFTQRRSFHKRTPTEMIKGNRLKAEKSENKNYSICVKSEFRNQNTQKIITEPRAADTKEKRIN